MTYIRKTLIVAFVSLTTAIAMTPAFAAYGETALGKCYNTVISSCNSTSKHPESCANSGMDACDAEYRNRAESAPLPFPRTFGNSRLQVGLLLPAVQSAREAARRG